MRFTTQNAKLMTRYGRFGLSAVLASVCCIGPGAHAQEQNTAERAQAGGIEEYVVTGTLIRGAAPTGAELISVTPADVVATGATSTDQLLANIPQVGNFFNSLPQIPTGTNNELQINRPNLRNLPGLNTQSGAATLVLVDGHRIVGAGVLQSAPDPDVLPPSVIERVEIVPDGGSATYGADAVGGVINFITKRHFNGVELTARYGFADNYNTTDGNVTVGHDWGTGSAYISYNFSYHDALFGSDRSYVKSIDWTTGIPTGRACDAPNIFIGGTSYASPGLVPGTFNACDLSKLATIYPREERNSVFGGVSQDFSDFIHFDLRSFFTRREDISSGGATSGTIGNVNITPANPYYENIPSAAGATQNVQFSYGPAFGEHFARQDTDLSEFGITPTLSIDLGSKWQVRAMLNYGRSNTSFFDQSINPTLITQYAAGTTASTALDPYAITSTNPKLLGGIENYEDTGVGISELTNARLIGDGKLVALPGGDLSVALGGEYIRDSFKTRSGFTNIGAEGSLPYSSYGRDVKAGFAELQIPIVGEANGIALIHALRVSASGRYDDYSDFGHTFNPKFALTYEPVDWIDVRGNWGRSFNAPTSLDELGSLNNQFAIVNFFHAVPAGQTAPPGSYTIAVQGTAQGLQPQTAHTYSIGLDVRPPVVPGLSVSATFYHIDFYGILGQAPVFNAPLLFAYYQKYVTLFPTAAQIAAFASLVPGGLAQVSQFLTPGGPLVYELLDFRRTNLGNAAISGLDFSLRYNHPTAFGSLDASLAGIYQLKDDQNAISGAPFASQIENGVSRFALQTIFGANWASPFGAGRGNLRGQAVWNHRGGYSVVESSTLPQTQVGSFDVINFFFIYNFDGTGLTKDLALTFSLNNAFNWDPPVDKTEGGTLSGTMIPGIINGATLGRLVQLGFDKKF